MALLALAVPLIVGLSVEPPPECVGTPEKQLACETKYLKDLDRLCGIVLEEIIAQNHTETARLIRESHRWWVSSRDAYCATGRKIDNASVLRCKIEITEPYYGVLDSLSLGAKKAQVGDPTAPATQQAAQPDAQ